MYHLSEIAEIKSHSLFSALKNSSIWQKPAYQITKQDWVNFADDNKDKDQLLMKELIAQANAAINLAKFLGQLETSREDNVIKISITSHQ